MKYIPKSNNHNQNNQTEDTYVLTRAEMEQVLRAGIAYYLMFDWKQVRTCDLDGWPFLCADEVYSEGMGDCPPVNWILMKAGLFKDENIPEDAYRWQEDVNHEPLSLRDWLAIYDHLGETAVKCGVYGSQNVIDNVLPERSYLADGEWKRHKYTLEEINEILKARSQNKDTTKEN